MIKLLRLSHVAITVSDVEATRRWYQRVLGLEQIHGDRWGLEPAMMVVPENQTGLAIFPPGVAEPHIAFETDAEGFEEAKRVLEQQGIEYRYEDHGPFE